jgi:hypothetical protein
MEAVIAIDKDVILNLANTLALSVTALAGFLSAFILFRLQAVDGLIAAATSNIDAFFPARDRTRLCLFSGDLAGYRQLRAEEIKSLADAEERGIAYALLESVAGLYRLKLLMIHEFKELMGFGVLLFAAALLIILFAATISQQSKVDAYGICGGLVLAFLIWGRQAWSLFHKILLSSVNLKTES